MKNDNRSELNEKKDAQREIEEARLEKVAGGVPILHPGHHYDPHKKDEPDDNNGEAGGASGTW